MLTSHMGILRPTRFFIAEKELNKSYWRIANILKTKPAMKGLYSISWLFSPDTLRVSPHLTWITKIFLDNGGLIAKLGKAELDCGVFDRSPERKKAFQEGTFLPTEGLALWPRKEMINWADRHPELED